ncbi:K+-transporting ATPase ATPase C chain [Methylomagnum ishizawai]|uniref:Potassium-transporting ATPase KdpC subunit n=1 Tax=Methylomagnum ishizawai TaxID=1760988 RepID=A0A1Y6CVD2_9GAMM|nr:potassium-transporting ATPase subunit KdpC [Methylomagnum ishizawai]SMF94256.1 K+-transporting ATPase ATPase C chain [Methylomagnum ishizawai]
MISHLKPACVLLVVFTVLTGMIYPAAVTGLAQVLFPAQANGSLIQGQDGQRQGSRLIGQPYSDPGLFWGRPSATAPYPYNAGASAGSNLGPLNPALKAAVQARIQALREADPGNIAPVPVDLVTASASGLDPQISPAAAEYQVGRVARARQLAPEIVRDLVARHTEGRQWGVLGEPRVNVLELNLELAALPR